MRAAPGPCLSPGPLRSPLFSPHSAAPRHRPRPQPPYLVLSHYLRPKCRPRVPVGTGRRVWAWEPIGLCGDAAGVGCAHDALPSVRRPAGAARPLGSVKVATYHVLTSSKPFSRDFTGWSFSCARLSRAERHVTSTAAPDVTHPTPSPPPRLPAAASTTLTWQKEPLPAYPTCCLLSVFLRLPHRAALPRAALPPSGTPLCVLCLGPFPTPLLSVSCALCPIVARWWCLAARLRVCCTITIVDVSDSWRPPGSVDSV